MMGHLKGVQHLCPSALIPMTGCLIAASEGESDFSGDDASAQLPPSGTVAADTDPEMMAMQGRAGAEDSIVSCALEAGRLVSWGGTSWFSAPHPGSFLPGGA